MKFSAFTAFVLATFAAGAFGKEYPVKPTQVNCRKGPGTSFGVVKTYKKGHKVEITCQTSGETIEGNNIWDKTEHGCYVADTYIKTGKDGYVTGKCKNVPKPPNNGAGPIKNDYPYKNSCGGVDKWRYYKCQCTSFVAWRVNKRLGVNFHNMYKGTNWGNANTWDNAAKRTGVTVNNKPKPGCIAQSNAGRYGHVAWVAAVNGDKVTIEEFNYGGRERYGTRTVHKSAFNYIHVKK
ncbi:hypothetical protein ACO1O0_001557 [Amphichorda felina]